MKKIMIVVAGLCTVAFISCKKEEEKATPEQTIEVSAPKVEEAKDSTSIKIGKDGVDINTKSGANSTSISVGGDAKQK
jgi:CRISPR/Cas system CMR-associated protein Cmr5 small subunit